MIDIVGVLADEAGPTALTGVVCVVDATHLLADLAQDSYSTHPALTRLAGRPVPHALVSVNQIEFASMLVLTGWEALETGDLSTVMSLLCHLNPSARLRVDHGELAWTSGEAYTAEQVRPGWVALLNGSHDPHMTDPRVTAFRYENVRPLHPARLGALLDGAALTDEELAAGPAEWVRFADPFPAWPQVAKDAD